MKKYPYLYEIPLLYLVLFGINRFLAPNLPAFIEVEPNPCWVGVLLFGFRYGVAAGLASGIVAALFYLGSAWFYLERYLFEELSFYILPSLFIIIGALVGAGVQRYQTTIAQLREEESLLRRNEKLLKEELQTIREINRGLEKKIVTRMSTLITLYEGARRLESVDVESLYREIPPFIAKTLEADELALYLKSGNQWGVRESFGWKEYKKWPKTLDLGEGLTGLAGTRGKVITIRDLLGALSPEQELPALMGDAVMAGPIRKGERGEILGVVSVQNLPFLHFNSSTVTLFSFLLDWVSRSLGHAFYVQDLRANEIIDPVHQVYSHRYFQSRGEEEFLRSKTYSLPLGAGLVSVSGLEGLSKPSRELLLKTVCQILLKCSREMDVIAVSPDPFIPFSLLWITASPRQAGEMRKKIEDDFAKLDLSAGLKMGLSNFSPQSGSFEKMLEEAREDLERG